MTNTTDTQNSAPRTLVIGEAAACHDGSLYKAQKLVYAAKNAGCDAVKMQWLSSPERLAARRRAPEYLDAYRLLSFPRAWFPTLVAECELTGIEFMCTSYLPEDIAVVAPYVKRFKVSSFESRDAHFLALHAEYLKPLIVSAGMGAQVHTALNAYRQAQSNRQPVVHWEDQPSLDVLHCVSAYPCPDDQINLRVLTGPRRLMYGYDFTGLSDHTKHPLTGALAVAAGAKIVEFHLRLDDTDPGNADYAVARTPAEAKEYIANIRQTERMMGDGNIRVMSAEAPMQRYVTVTTG